MSDFLGNLVARGRGSPNVVKPRVPGLFEQVEPSASVRGSAASFADQQIESVADSEADTPDPMMKVGREEQSPRMRSSRDDYFQTSGKDQEAALRLQRDSRQDKHGESTLLGRDNSMMVQKWAELDEKVRAFRTKKADSREPQLGRQETTARVIGPADRDGETQGRQQRKLELGRAEALKESRVANVVEPQMAPLVPASPVAPMFSPEKDTAATRRSRDQRRHDREIDVQPPEQVIQVTIGRVEVRAVQQEGASRKGERTKSSVMSLEEYLQKRSTGAAP